MIRIAVISDSHGDTYYVPKFFEKERNADYIFHLGDGASDTEKYIPACRSIVCQVAGNRDFIAGFPSTREITVGGVSFLLTHGHCHGVKNSRRQLLEDAERRGVRVALYGHTHEPFYAIENGIHILNPGSLKRGDYACIDVEDDGIFTVTAERLY